jgi:protein tyrosine phosphatase (PTP) superfamily phosphohydrolase (DUF442 family)
MAREAKHFPISPATITVDAFAELERLIDMLPRPITISCKSAVRASAVACAYTGVKRGDSSALVMATAAEERMPFLQNEAMKSWVQGVLQRC